MSLRTLPPLLRSEPALADLLGADDAVVAVPEAARAFVLAGLVALGAAPVILAATTTASEAERLVHDLAAFAGPDRVEMLPAWETLPFERVSPGVETMGRRLRAAWHLRRLARAPGTADGAGGTRVLVVPVRSLLQRLPSELDHAAPLVVRRGETRDPDELLEHLVFAGYRREYQVEHRGEVSVRGGILDVFPSTFDTGVRIDLFGDEVDRLTEFDVSDQRSVRDVDEVEIFGCRELVPVEAVRQRARALVGSAPFARDQFERIAEGLVFDGMESWLPWLSPEDRLVTDLLPEGARVVLVEPRRMRDRAAELAHEEAALAEALAATWDLETAAELPRLHLPYERLLARTPAKVVSVMGTAERPDTPAIEATGWPPVLGDAAALARRIGELVGRGYRVVVAADGAGSALRLAEVLAGEGVVVQQPGAEGALDGAVQVLVEPLDRGFVLPGA